jgi:ATP-dependent protease ClpP protease subunit
VTTTILNGAVAVHHTATVDTTWDGPAAVAAMPNDAAALKYCHAWQDGSGKPDAKSSYKFPHATKDGGPANLAGCRNGLARLPGSNIPAADKPGVERHLKAHLSDGGSDADNYDHHHATGGQRVDKERREWFTIRNADSGTDGPAQVYIYDMIGDGGWFGGGITAIDFVAELTAIKNTAIDLHINSPGGDVADGITIYNAVRRHPANVTVYIDGIAASAASFIAQAGNSVLIERNAQIMVHDASGLCYGTAMDMQKMTDRLNKCSDNIADVYSQRTGVDQSTWRDVMKEEVWYSSAEAVMAGLADSVMPEPVTTDARLTSRARFDLKAMGYRYSSRNEAPDPPVPNQQRAPKVPAPIAETSSIPVLPGSQRLTAHTETEVAVEPAASRVTATFEAAILRAIERGFRAQIAPVAEVTPIDPAPSDDPLFGDGVPEPVAEVELSELFDPESFRNGIRRAVAQTR